MTKRTPYEIVFNYKMVGKCDNPLTRDIQKLYAGLGAKEEKESVEELLEQNRATLKKQFDKKRKKPHLYQEGDLVLVEQKQPATGGSRKLDKRAREPYEIKNVIGNDRYVVEDIEGEQQSHRPCKGIVAVDRLIEIPKQSS